MSEARNKEIEKAKMLDLGKHPMTTVVVFSAIAIIPVLAVIELVQIFIKLLAV